MLPVNLYIMAHRQKSFLVTVRQMSILLAVSHSVHSNNTTVKFSMLYQRKTQHGLHGNNVNCNFSVITLATQKTNILFHN
jgi:hypothetical protein